MRRSIMVAAIATVLTVSLLPADAATNDPYFAKQWGLTKIQAEQAWPTADGTGALVAVVDTGVDLGHPDLASKLVVFNDADFSEPNGTCTGGKAKVCTQDGPQDKNGHGTHVAGIVGAITGNGVGVAGTAPGAKILPVRVLDAGGSGTTGQIAAGIRYAADKGAKVINLSLGFQSGLDQVAKLTGQVAPVYSAIDYAWSKGAVIVTAAGNDTVPICAEPSGHPKVICVGATDVRDLRTYYSNGDATTTSPFMVAPGGAGLDCAGEIFSTVLRTIATYCNGGVKGYDGYAGTSMAAPHVAGVAALLAGKGLANSAIVSRIFSTTDDLGVPGRDSLYGYGRVNAAKAVAGL